MRVGSARSLSGHLSVRGSPSARGNGKKPFPLLLVLPFRTPKLSSPFLPVPDGRCFRRGKASHAQRGIATWRRSSGPAGSQQAGERPLPGRQRRRERPAQQRVKGRGRGLSRVIGQIMCSKQKVCVCVPVSHCIGSICTTLILSLSFLLLSPHFALPISPSLFPLFRQRLLDSSTKHLLTWKYTDTIAKETVDSITRFQVALFGRFYPDLIPVMEDSGIQRGIWDGDAKAVQQCLTDIFTSVYTTCDIPENAIFGPCILSHTSLYDSIAFIALKSTDKRTVPYIFRVDTSAANGSSEGLMWLRLVQSARDKEEQNLEAYIKNGQLFYRSLRRIAKDEELLVWYGKELTELLLLCPSRPHSKMNGSSPYTCLECSQRFQFEFPYVAHLRFRCPKRIHSTDRSPQDEQGGGVGTKDHGGGGGGGGKEQQQQQQQQQQEAPLGPGPKFCKAGPFHHYPTPSAEGSNPPVTGGSGSSKPSTDFHNLARELENSGGGSSCSPVRSLSSSSSSGSGGGSGSGHQEAELSPDGNVVGQGKGKRKFPEEATEGGGGAGLSGGRGRFAERPLPASKEDLVCTPQQYRASGSYFGLEENGRLFAPPSPETGEAKRSAFVEVKKAARAPGLQEEAAADSGIATVDDQEAGSGGGSSTPVAASPASAEKLLAPRPGGPLPSRLEGGSPARGSAFTSVSQLGGGGAGGGAGAGSAGGTGGAGSCQGAASDERKSAFSQPARSFSQLSPLVLGQKLSALEPCHPSDGVGPTRLYPAAPDPLAVKLQGAADLNGGCAALQSGGGGLPKQSPFLYATAFWPKSSAAAGPLQLQLPSALTLLPPSFTSLCLPAQNWCAKCNASFRMTSDLVYHMRSHHKKEYAMEPLVKRRREEKLKCPICNESFRERHHLSRHMTSHN